MTMMIELPSTRSMISGQVSDLLEIRESSLSQPLVLSETQLKEIRELGKELASKRSFYGIDDDGDGDGDTDLENRGSPEVIKCVSTDNGLHRIHVGNAIGAISLSGLTIYILPKISLNHFAHLASRTFEDHRSHNNSVQVSSLNALRNVLASWCISSIESLIKVGLVSEYVGFEESLLVVRGRINTVETTLNFLSGRPLADCRFEDLDIDNPLNRILKSALGIISMEQNGFSSELRFRAREIYRRLPRVGRASNLDYKMKLGRHSKHCANAFDLSLRIIAGSAIDIRSGPVGGQSFLIPTPGLIEAAIRKILETNLAPIQVRKSGKVISQSVYFSINPDLVFNNGSVTGDVKYKIASTNWVRNDVAQAAMFATGFNAKAAVIVTFSNSLGNVDLEMNLGELALHRIIWNSDQGKDPIEAEEEFIARMRAFILPYQGAV